MAVPPVTQDAFVREVDEELRRDQMTTVWRRYGRLIIAAIVLGLVALAAFLYWQHRQEEKAGDRAVTLATALADLGDGKAAEANAALATLATADDRSYAVAAKLTQAGAALLKGDARSAAAGFATVANDATAPQPMRDLALIRGTAAAFDTLPPQAVIDRLKPLAVPGNAWFGSAAEMTALAWLKLSKPAPAGKLFAAIAKDRTVPETLRSRALRISGALGVDTVATVQNTRG